MKIRNTVNKNLIVLGLLAAATVALPMSLTADGEIKVDAISATHNLDTSTSVFEGDVVMKKEDLTIVANRVELRKMKEGKGIATATGTPLTFNIGKPKDDDYVTGSAMQAIVDYRVNQLRLIGDVKITGENSVMKTHEAIYNLDTRELKASGSGTAEATTKSSERTTIVVDLDEN